MARSRPAVRTAALVAGVLLVLVASAQAPPARAQDANPTESPIEEPSPVLDDDGEVVTNDRIDALRDEWDDTTAELVTIARGESRTERRAARARDQLDTADREVTAAAQAADVAAVELVLAEERLEGAEDRLTTARAARDEVTDQLAATDVQLDATRLQLQRRLREAWMHGGQLSSTTMVLGMDDFNDVVRVQHLLGQVVEDDNQLVADYLRLQLQRQDRLAATTLEEARVTDANRAAEASRDERATADDEARRTASRTRERRRHRADVLATVEQDLANLGEDRLVAEEQLDEVTARLEAEVETELAARREAARVEAERLEAARISAAEAAAAAELVAQQRRVVSSGGGGGGRCGSTSDWVWPVDGCVTSGYGGRYHPILKTRRIHAGMDFGASAGTPIHAVADGTVYRAGWSSGGHGNVVVIDHGNVATLYAHQERLAVRAGQRVVAGQVIGWVGSTGLSTGPHLHFETHAGGPYVNAVNPAPWFR